MAEGPLGSLLGEEVEQSEPVEVETGSSVTASADAFATAVVALASRQDPLVAQGTVVFLERQCRLLEIQSNHLVEEHALRLAHLQNQLSEESVRRLAVRLRVAFQVFLGSSQLRL